MLHFFIFRRKWQKPLFAARSGINAADTDGIGLTRAEESG
jgi:hypothetical protein